MDQKQVYHLNEYTDVSDPAKVLAEIRLLAAGMGVSDFTVIERIYADIIRLFDGKFPGYRNSNTRYHDLEHTCAVTLAVVRLIHGVWLEGKTVSPRDISLGIIAALFHDTGLIQTEDDTEGTGAKYTIGHEQRSIALMRSYLPSRGFDQEAIEDCANMILYTILNKPVREIPFRSESVSLIGRIIGSADLLGQMADRLYLEKLPLLFFEFQEGGLANYNSELDLLAATENFYEHVFRKRLYGDMEGVANAMRSHFRARWDIDRDLYLDSVEKNIAYLRSLYESCGDKFPCYLKKLRRGNIIRNLYGNQ